MKKILISLLLSILPLFQTVVAKPALTISEVEPLPIKIELGKAAEGIYLLKALPEQTIRLKTNMPFEYGAKVIPETSPGFCGDVTDVITMPIEGSCKFKLKLYPQHHLGTIRITVGACFTENQECVSHKLASQIFQLNSIIVTPEKVNVTEGGAQQFYAIGAYSDGSTKAITDEVFWQTNDNCVAKFNDPEQKGKIVAQEVGEAIITAQKDGITSNEANLTVTAKVLVSIKVKPESKSISQGHTQPYSATGHYSDSSQEKLNSSVD